MAAESRAAASRAPADRAAADLAAGGLPAEDRATESRAAEDRATEDRATEDRATESRAAEVPTHGALFTGRNLRYSYLDRFPALDGVSLDIYPGEKLALLGANGCGKSTLLKILDGLLFPASGTLHAFGELITEDALEGQDFSTAFRSRVGFVFQNSDVQIFSSTVREEVAFGCLQLGMSREETESRIDDVLDLLDIGALAGRVPFQLSGGQKKRVAIASVLVMNPQVLLFDEPTAALDPRSRQWLMELIDELAAAGKTIALATHDLDALEHLADRCLVLGEDHRIAGTGPTAEVLADRALLLDANLVSEPAGRPGAQPTGRRRR